MNAAIYARKSTAQKGKADTAKSVPQQIDGARDFIESKGWALNDAHIYSDDEISGAEFANRPGFQQLMAAAVQPKPPFQVLVIRELSRLGREASETGWVIKQLGVSGVEIVDVQGQSLTPKNWRDKALSGLQSAADEAHREASSLAVHAAFTRMHEAGKVVGGRVFGYRNVHIYQGEDHNGNPLFSHVERVIDETEAAVVRRIFEMYDSGLGLKRIAKMLTEEGVAKPRPPIRKDGLTPMSGWAPSTVREALVRETYRGVVVWNKSKKKNAWGQWAPTDRPESEWLRTEVPQLRIIGDGLWNRVQSSRIGLEGKAIRFESGQLSGRPPKNGTLNLLAGLATCGVCGGGLVVESGGKKRGRYPEYICARHRTNRSCPNALRIRVADVNEAVLQAIEEHALTPEAIEAVIQMSERDDVQDAQTRLERERRDVEKRIANITAAIEADGMGSLLKRLRELEDRLKAIDEELRSLQPVPRLAPAVIEGRLAEWRRLLRSSTTQARTVLQRILIGRITFTPVTDSLDLGETGYDFTAPTRFDKLFSGIATPRPKKLDPNDRAGLEDIGPDDMLDGDYDRLLTRVLKTRGRGGAPGGI